MKLGSEDTDMSSVNINKDNGQVNLTFGAATTAGELRDALGKVPAGTPLDALTVTYFSDAESCQGQDVPDDVHDFFVATLSPYVIVCDDCAAEAEGIEK